MKKLMLAVLCVSFAALYADESPYYKHFIPSVYYSSYISNAAVSRGRIIEDRPNWENLALLTWSVKDFRFGAIHWNTTSLTDRSPYYHKVLNEHDWGAFVGYDYAIADDWVLSNDVMCYWMIYEHGKGIYPKTDKTDFEWDWSGSLQNPYLTPYWRMRVGANKGGWVTTTLGVKHGFSFLDNFTLTPSVFVEVGDGRMNEMRYRGGAGSRYDRSIGSGLQTYNAMLRLSYKVNDYFSVFASVRQFVTANHEGRHTLQKPHPRDLTIGSMGFELNF